MVQHRIESNANGVQNFIGNQTNLLSQVHGLFWDQGGTAKTSVVDLLKGGAYMGPTVMPDNSTKQDTLNKNLAQYYENMILESLTNTWLKNADVFIIFVRYPQRVQ